MKKKKIVSVYIDEDVIKEVSKIARSEDRSLSYILSRLIEQSIKIKSKVIDHAKDR
jgi:predicted transcriptional regulator